MNGKDVTECVRNVAVAGLALVTTGIELAFVYYGGSFIKFMSYWLGVSS